MVVSAQLRDAPAKPPATLDGRIAEARAGRLPPGGGGLPLDAIIAALPPAATLSVEIPAAAGDPEARARRIFDATQGLIARSFRTAP